MRLGQEGVYIYPPTITKKHATNYDRIVSKTPEELAEWIAGYVLNLTGGSFEMSKQAWLEWLRQEAKDDEV